MHFPIYPGFSFLYSVQRTRNEIFHRRCKFEEIENRECICQKKEKIKFSSDLATLNTVVHDAAAELKCRDVKVYRKKANIFIVRVTACCTHSYASRCDPSCSVGRAASHSLRVSAI